MKAASRLLLRADASLTAAAPEAPVTIGELGKAFGVKGWCWVYSHTRPADGLTQYRRWWVSPRQPGQSPRWLEVARFAVQGNGLIVKLKGVDQREAAELLTGATIAIGADALPQPAAGEYYWRDLIGCQVQHVQGQDLGVVRELLETGANDVLVVEGERERLIPFIPGEVLVAIDVANRRIVADWDPEF
ncbi:ribosome maturation factor RimM [Halothiobacillus sp. DCM-1]|uniref:ribosome maturation factor RimM n=1 Tax=Halothiobacillus sp. DCM-1 TaxID=3112558 RepID=UPI00324893F3